MKTWLAALLLTGAAAYGATLTSTNTPRPDLVGRILTPESSPLPDATIFIYAAGPKVGRGTL
jgi:hypothetical protein